MLTCSSNATFVGVHTCKQAPPPSPPRDDEVVSKNEEVAGTMDQKEPGKRKGKEKEKGKETPEKEPPTDSEETASYESEEDMDEDDFNELADLAADLVDVSAI